MGIIIDYVDFQAVLQTASSPRASFGIQLFLSKDDANLAAASGDYEFVTKSDYATVLSTKTEESYLFAHSYFQQKRTASTLMIGQWDSTADPLPLDALAAIQELNDTFWMVSERGMVQAEQETFAAGVNAMSKALVLVTNDADSYDSGSTTDLAYNLKALSQKRVMVIYHDDSAVYPDACVNGCVIPATEGTTAWSFETLSAIDQSGQETTGDPLTTTQKAALEAKNCQFIDTVGSNTFLACGLKSGLTVGGEEMRIILGRDWFVARYNEGLFTDMLNSPVHLFDNNTIGRAETLLRKLFAEGKTRNIFVDTPDRPFTVNFPDADDITAGERASHGLTITEAFIIYLNTSISKWSIVGTLTI